MFTDQSLSSLYEGYNAVSVNGTTYKFVGFAYDSNGNEMLTGDEVMPDKNLSLYAIWKKIEYVLVVDNNTTYTLSLENRVIFLQRYWFSDTYSDIAKKVGISEKSVSVRLTRIRRRMREYLLEREVLV